MASTGTATGPQEADGTVHQPEAAAGVDSQHSGAQFRQEGASLSETGQAAGIKGSSSTAAELGLPDDVDDGSGSGLASGSEGSKTAFDAVEAAPDHDHSGNRGQVGADGAGAVGADGQIIRHPKLVISASGKMAGPAPLQSGPTGPIDMRRMLRDRQKARRSDSEPQPDTRDAAGPPSGGTLIGGDTVSQDAAVPAMQAGSNTVYDQPPSVSGPLDHLDVATEPTFKGGDAPRCNFLQVEISMVLQNLLIFINTDFDSELIKIGRRVLCTLTSFE